MSATPSHLPTRSNPLPRHEPGRHQLNLVGRDAIEGLVEQLNRLCPSVERRVEGWGTGGCDMLSIDMVLHALPDKASSTRVFRCEERASMAQDITARHAWAAPDCYVVVLPLAGDVRVTTSDHRVHARPGEGVILEMNDIERTRFPGGSRHVEFVLPMRDVKRLADAWAPGCADRAPRFAPHMHTQLASNLSQMANHASALMTTADAGEPGSLMLFQRWMELMALTLLHRQPIEHRAVHCRTIAKESPAGLRRAIDFIHAHADAPIDLADIAEAACMSLSGLLRYFNAHVGLPPYAYLRAVRLERARDELRKGAPASIRELALRWGFQNPSKFSIAYRARFGEAPSETRARGVR